MKELKYPFSIRLLHWAMAVFILGLVVLGYYMAPYDSHEPHTAEQLYFWHKSFGVLVMFLIFLRIIVRAKSNIPALPSGLKSWELSLSKISHRLLYILMVLVPLTGYLDSSAYPYSSGVHFFIVDLPDIVAKDEQVAKIGNILHKIFAYSLLATVAIHVAGALKHRFFDTENDVLGRIT